MRDPKFGYHWIWMIPIALAYEAFTKCEELFHRICMKITHKRNPDIKQLSKLAEKRGE
jgi:hypothetical protein